MMRNLENKIPFLATNEHLPAILAGCAPKKTDSVLTVLGAGDQALAL